MSNKELTIKTDNKHIKYLNTIYFSQNKTQIIEFKIPKETENNKKFEVNISDHNYSKNINVIY